ncbi:MAG: hypothetical protein IT356_12510 [Gemmatimonadaceae bacterium]|nr:hypothetical protein [Gemmatimonadaceae bacterium]
MKHWKQVVPALGLLLLFALVSKCQGDRWARDRAALIQQADSLRVQSRADSVIAAEASALADRYAAERETAQDRAGEAIAEADRLRAERRRLVAAAGRVDTAAAVPEPVTVADSALTNCEEEVVVLRAAIDADRTAAQLADAEVMELRGALALERTSAADLRVSNAALVQRLASAAPPCRIAFWGCPSRMTVAVTAAIAGAVGTYVVLK